MTVPKLNDLPSPPPDRTGWPWTETCSSPSENRGDSTHCPKITIVTPSYNQGEFIEETIRSVLLQGYPNLEYIIIDGGSKDQSVDIIKKYSKWIANWVSEPDRGQSHAINKGFAAATGEIFGWLCSDDLLTPGALNRVGQYFAEKKDCRWLAGPGDFVTLETGEVEHFLAGICSATALMKFWNYGFNGYFMPQPSTFWSKSLWQDVGGLREDNHLAMDYELWLMFEEYTKLHLVPDTLSISQLHGECKTSSRTDDQFLEMMRCAYHAAERRGYSSAWLSRCLLWHIFRRRLRCCLGFTRRLRPLSALGELAILVQAFAKIWSENGRLGLLNKL